MELNYKKNNNEDLFLQMNSHDLLNLENAQNYIPIYEKFFNFTEKNYNSINLNNSYKLNSVESKLGYSKFMGKVIDISNNINDKKLFFKYSPLVDPVKYMIGNYDNSYNILELPKFNNKDNKKIHEKMFDPNNSAYSDGFFSFLSSNLLNNYNFYNGIDYYGSFLAFKNNFIVDIDDDIEYLDDSEYFHKNNRILFTVLENEKYKNIFRNTKKYKQKIEFESDENDDTINLLLNINDLTIINTEISDSTIINISNEIINNNNEKIQVELNLDLEQHLNVDINVDLDQDLDLDLDLDLDQNLNVDLTDNNNDTINSPDKLINSPESNSDIKKKKKRTNGLNESESTCSSRYSNTNSSNSKSGSESYSDDSNSDNDNNSNSNSEDSSSESDGHELYVSINKFPVQTIAMECCEDTIDSYIINNKIKDNEWESIVLQILFTLITYQKIFDFTHNDLHTNNIVYIKTEKKFLYYKYENKHYKVPTFGKIYKIIDFGRAIYKFKGEIICSDSYAPQGDANSQYNCEPYFNENKARIDPNKSFDLCRLGCSLFDYFVDDIEDIKTLRSPIKKIMVAWVFDDNNKNILYKNDGNERYPDFKLYKMIARTVHKHTPHKVLKNSLFDKYTIAKKKINSGTIINIDIMPLMV